MRAVAVLIFLVCFVTLMAPTVHAQVDSAGAGVGREIAPLRDTLLKPIPLFQFKQLGTPLALDASLDSLLHENPQLREAILRRLIVASLPESNVPSADEELNRRLRASAQFSQFEIMGLVAKRKQENAPHPPLHGKLGQLSITGLIHLIEDLTK
jgi:hypothetical protein